MASIIRSCLEEFNAARPGTVYDDPTTDDLSSVFRQPGSRYFVVTLEGAVVAGGGIYPTAGLPPGTCELVKMYVSREFRSRGLATKLLGRCLEEARRSGYRRMYLETMPELSHAISLYQKNGFSFLPGQLGHSGHCGCDLFMIRDI